MYCPKCAESAPENAKFCRACGTDLKTVALALRGELVPANPTKPDKDKQPLTAEDWLAKQRTALSDTIQGAVLLGISLLLGLAAAVFANGDFPWFLIWLVFFGWLAVWGAIALAYGLGGLSETQIWTRQRRFTASSQTAAPPASAALPVDTAMLLAETSAVPASPIPVSVIEETTKSLGRYQSTN